jgi:1-acyl-sn-glycerol-3-phosphate acyltransferase
MVTASNIVLPPTVTVGKKPAVDPVFGQLYWLTGNLLIDRNNRAKAHSTIAEVVNHFKKRKISIWMFPEGNAAAGAACCRLKPVRFMPQLRQVFQLFLCAFPILRIRLILTA